MAGEKPKVERGDVETLGPVFARFKKGQRVRALCSEAGKLKVGSVQALKFVSGEAGLVMRYDVAFFPEYATQIKVVELPDNVISPVDDETYDAPQLVWLELRDGKPSDPVVR